jgi:hypothetical protein
MIMLAIGILVKLYERHFLSFEIGTGTIQYASAVTVMVLCAFVVVIRARTLYKGEASK